ncbi:MAG: ribbon-helix-helix domain-containing protein [Nitrososphaera sp.]|nr:ribbon-helix-helix domain-containing protein [Nitrososphaera sp.]
MALVNARIDDKLLKDFRHVVYVKYGLRKGDLTRALEEAIRDYVTKNSEIGKKSATQNT